MALVTVTPHTTALRGNEWEVAIPTPFLKERAFHIQQVQSISLPKLMQRLGSMTNEEWDLIAAKLLERLGLVT